MNGLSRFVRRTPAAFWLALVGVGFWLCVFVSGVFGEQGPFALTFMVPAFLLMALLSAFKEPALKLAAAVFAGLTALVLGMLAIGPYPTPVPNLIHVTGMAIAAAAAASDFFAARRSRPLTTA